MPALELSGSLKPNARVAWLGVGSMGTRLCRHALDAGYQVTAYDLRVGQLEQVVDMGATPASSIAAATSGADIIISTMRNDASLRAAALGEDGALCNARQHAIYIDMSTVTPSLSSEIAIAAASWQVKYLRVAMSGTYIDSEQGTLMELISGDRDVYEYVQPLIRLFGKKQFFVGHGEEARYAKLVLNLLLAINACALGEALALGRKGGLDWLQMLDVIEASPLASPVIQSKLPKLRARDFSPLYSVERLVNDLDCIISAAKQQNVPVSLSALVQQNLETRLAHGGANDDYISVVKLYEWLSAITDEPSGIG